MQSAVDPGATQAAPLPTEPVTEPAPIPEKSVAAGTALVRVLLKGSLMASISTVQEVWGSGKASIQG